MNNLKVGDICVWQNCPGEWSYLNGIETEIIGDLRTGFYFFSSEPGPPAYLTSTPNPVAPGYLLGEPHELRKKRPPESDDAAARQAMLDCIERAKMPSEVSA